MKKNDKDKKKGLYRKYFVMRLDERSQNVPLMLVHNTRSTLSSRAHLRVVSPKKHAKCEYFVFDLVHDKFAMPALGIYANMCREEYPQLAADLDKKLKEARKRAR